MSYQPTSGQGSNAVTATVSNTASTFGSGSGTVASGGQAGPGTSATAMATEIYEAADLNILNQGTTPVSPQSLGKY